MATHSSILAWRIPRTEESLVGYSPWGCKESDTTEQLSLTHSLLIKNLPETQKTSVQFLGREDPLEKG